MIPRKKLWFYPEPDLILKQKMVVKKESSVYLLQRRTKEAEIQFRGTGISKVLRSRSVENSELGDNNSWQKWPETIQTNLLKTLLNSQKLISSCSEVVRSKTGLKTILLWGFEQLLHLFRRPGFSSFCLISVYGSQIVKLNYANHSNNKNENTFRERLIQSNLNWYCDLERMK